MSEHFDKRAVSGHVTDDLSAYIDNMLEADERRRVRAHIELCAGCKADYIELRATQQLLHAVPMVAAPRAFTLTQEMVPPPESFWQRLLVPRNVPRFATGSVLAFALMLLVLVGNYNALSSQPTASTMSAESGAARTMKSAAVATPSDNAVVPLAAPLASATPQEQSDAAMGAYPQTPVAGELSNGGMGFQPQATSASAQDSSSIQPSGVSSPSTKGYGQAVPPGESPETPQTAPQSPANGSTALPAIEGLLALLGIAMAVAAFAARRGSGI